MGPGLVTNIGKEPRMVRRLLMMLAVLAALFAAGGTASAADAPRWVAAIYVDAQRAVGLRWNPVVGATGYKVLRSETSGAGYQEIAASAQPQYFDKTIEPGSTYFYVLQSVAGAEVSVNSEQKSVSIPGQKVKKLAAPTFASVSGQQSTEFGKTTYKTGLVWNRVPDAIAYNVYRSSVAGKDYQMLGSVSETQYVDATVEESKTYYYVLTALDGSFQETPYSAEQKVTLEKKKDEKKTKIKIKPAGRVSKLLWRKIKGDENNAFDFWEPYDLEYSPGSKTLIAGSSNTKQIFVLDAATGAMVKKFGANGTEPGQFMELLGIGLDADDNVVVADKQGRKLVIYTQDGKFVREVVATGLPKDYTDKYTTGWAPIDVAVDFKTDEFFVADTVSGTILVLNEKGAFQRALGEKGKPGEMRSPMYVRINDAGQVVVLDMANTKIVTFEREGAFVSSWGENKASVAGFVFIGPFGYDSAGNFAIIDRSSATVRGYLPDSRYLYNMANEKGDGGADIYLPKAVATDPKTDRVFVAEGLIDRIQAFQMTGPIPAPQAELGQEE